MGQYHIVVNIDKQEYLHAHRMGDGLKMLEFGCSGNGVMTGLTILLACSHDRGGGDLHVDVSNPVHKAAFDAAAGRWAGDRIIIVGDYTEKGDPGTEHFPEEAWAKREDGYNGNPYSYVQKHYTDVSAIAMKAMMLDNYIRRDLITGYGAEERVPMAKELGFEIPVET